MAKGSTKKIIDVSKKVHSKNDASLFKTTIDILNCKKKYNIGTDEYYDSEFYLLDEDKRKNYIPESLNLYWSNKYNDKNYKYIFDNREEFNKTFINFINRDFFIINGKNYNEFVNFLIGKSKIVVKPIKKSNNARIEVVRINAKTNRKEIYDNFFKNKTLLIEEYIKQEKELNKLCESCTSSVAITTFVDDNKEVHVLNRIFKIGVDGLLNNLSKGGLFTLLDKDGKIMYEPISKKGKKFKVHPKSNIIFNNYIYNNIKLLERFVTHIAKHTEFARYVTWDVTISEKGPTLIGASFVPKVFNIKPSINEKFVGKKKEYVYYMKEGIFNE